MIREKSINEHDWVAAIRQRNIFDNNLIEWDYRCIVLNKCTYGACKQKLNAAMKKTLKNSHVRNNRTLMNERDMPFRVTYISWTMSAYKSWKIVRGKPTSMENCPRNEQGPKIFFVWLVLFSCAEFIFLCDRFSRNLKKKGKFFLCGECLFLWWIPSL